MLRRGTPQVVLAAVLMVIASGGNSKADALLSEASVGVITYAPTRTKLAEGDEVRVDVLIELPSGQTQPGCMPVRPLNLAGYEVVCTFDPVALEYVGGAVCPDTPPQFTRASFTSSDYANEVGGAAGVGTALEEYVSVARACFASVRFRARPGREGWTAIVFGRHPSWGGTMLASFTACPPVGPHEIEHNDGEIVLQVGVNGSRPGSGDLNGDEKVDVLDVVALASYLVGNTKAGSPPFVAGLSAADENGDATVNILDLVSLVARIVDGVEAK